MAGGDRSDDAIEQDIRARLTWDPEIEGPSFRSMSQRAS